MAAAPYLIVSPLSFMSLVGLIGGRPELPPADPGVVDTLSIDAFVYAHNEGKNIALALASLARQTKKPGKVFIVNDASTDDTKAVIEAFSQMDEVDVILAERQTRQGKVPSLEQIARFSDADVLFVLDGNTMLESPDYIEKTMVELFRTTSNASASGFITPMMNSDRVRASKWKLVTNLLHYKPDTRLFNEDGVPDKMLRAVTNYYCDLLNYVGQNILSLGEFSLFGTLVNPPTCAVSYRRDMLVDLFKKSRPSQDSKAPAGEDFFVEFGFIQRGFHNVQVLDVRANSHERHASHLFKKLYLWSKTWLQSSYFFPQLVTLPFKAMKRRRKAGAKNIFDESVYVPYQEPFGHLRGGSSKGRVGWTVLIAMIEKIAFPLILLLLLVERGWQVMLLIIFWESILYALITGIYGKKDKMKYVARSILMIPLRYFSIFTDVFVVGKFLVELAIPSKPIKTA